MLKRLCLSLILVLSLVSVYGQSINGELNNYVVKIAVICPGDEIYMWWGHIVMAVEDTFRGVTKYYNWGTFESPSDNFLKDFTGGKLLYSVSYGYINNISELLDEDWDISVYTLNLDKRAKEIIISYAENNILPENCYYDYHEFRDNCSTRIRDIIDMGTMGQFKAAFYVETAKSSVRRQIQRYTGSRPLACRFLNFLMGQNFDLKITPWEEMFLPGEVANNITGFSYIDEYGAERRLVSEIQRFGSSKTRPPVLDKPPALWLFSLAAGIFAAGVIFFIRACKRRHPRTAVIILGLSQSLLGLILGVSGCVLFFGLFFLKNDYIQQNINILFVNPLLLIVVPLGILSTVNKPRRINPNKALRVIWTFVFILGCVSIFLKVLPCFYQQNWDTLGAVLPAAFALSGIIKEDNVARKK